MIRIPFNLILHVGWIYIHCHPQIDCFVLSELFSEARHAGRSKPGSKPVQIYVRLIFRPLGHKADHVGSGNFKVFILATAASFVYISYTIGYQSAQFFQRALHYASGGRQFLRQITQPPWGSVYIYIYVCVCVCMCVCVCVYVCLLSSPHRHHGTPDRFFNQGLRYLNSEFSFFHTGCRTNREMTECILYFFRRG